MLRLHTGRDAQGAKAYFDQGLSREDYYTEGREVVGTWHGLGAERLGLEGAVDREAFHALCENRDPRTAERLTARQKENRRVGFDISFSVPKSVSIHQALMDDAEMLEAFKGAVRETMIEMEKDAQTRVRKGGANHNRTTGNLVWSEFIHYTARPVEGRSDPHLHAHCWTFNSTYDEKEQRWKALDLEEIWKRAPYYEAAFEARLALKLKGLGYEIERNERGWEIGGYSRDLVERFSRRTQLIDAFAAARGIESDALKDALGARTREAKQENEEKDAQRREWAARLSRNDRETIAGIERNRAVGKGRNPMRKNAVTAENCLDFAAAHSFERQSVTREANFLADALKFGVGEVTPESIEREFDNRKRNGAILAARIGGSDHDTTPEVLEDELQMVSWARDGRGTKRALGQAPECREAAHRELLSGGRHPDSRQIAAVEHVLSSQDRVMLIRGKAGTGKTSIMKAARDGIRAGGRDVHFFAPGAEASRGVLAAEGFENATTVARLLKDEALQREIRDQVIWVDEAGTMGARDMRGLFQIAEQANARVILSGDVTQHAPVARGDALRVLENEAGLKPAELTRIYRQTQTEYRSAVEAISTGDPRDVGQGFDRLDRMGAIEEIGDDARYQRLAEAYLETVLEDQKTALVVSPTHKEGETVTRTIREGLRDAGALASEEHRISRLRSLNLTEAERGDAVNYRPGQVVQAHGRIKGIKRGVKYGVVRAEKGAVLVEPAVGENAAGNPTKLPLDKSAKFEVFARDEISIAVGEQIRITKNGMAASRTPAGRKQELRNGAIYEVEGFTENGDIQAAHRSPKGAVTSRTVIGRDFGNLTHGYCVTSHASQGKTVDRVLIAQSAASFRASSREQFYVSVSRGRSGVTIFTDDKEALRARVVESATRMSASEFSRAQQKQSRDMQRHVLWTQRLMQEARSFARAQAQAIVRGARGMSQAIRRGRDGPERHL